jgi:DNA-binding transcriptional LysR family regulator
MPTLGELRAFTVVADELHFARAARRLGIAPPSLSQTIRRLEDRLDAILLVRTPRTVELTEAGAELLPRARDILVRFDAAQAALHPAHDGGRLTVGIASNGFAELTSPIINAFRRSHPDVRVILRDITEQHAPVASGAVDVALVRPPVEEQGDARLRCTAVVEEPRVALLPSRHPLADAESIAIAELEGEAFVEVGPGRAPITDYWAATAGFGGVRQPLGSGADTVAGVLQAVAYLGEVITSVPSVLRFFQVPGIAVVPIRDITPATMAIITRAGDERALTRDFAAAVELVAAAAIELVPDARVIAEDSPLRLAHMSR